MAEYNAALSISEYWVQSTVNYWTAIAFPAIYFAKYL